MSVTSDPIFSLTCIACCHSYCAISLLVNPELPHAVQTLSANGRLIFCYINTLCSSVTVSGQFITASNALTSFQGEWVRAVWITLKAALIDFVTYSHIMKVYEDFGNK